MSQKVSVKEWLQKRFNFVMTEGVNSIKFHVTDRISLADMVYLSYLNGNKSVVDVTLKRSGKGITVIVIFEPGTE